MHEKLVTIEPYTTLVILPATLKTLIDKRRIVTDIDLIVHAIILACLYVKLYLK